MPELPEVETVRRGLQQVLCGRGIIEVDVRSARSIRRQPEGSTGLVAGVRGATVAGVHRRGKYLWWALDGTRSRVLTAHLGMSGQFRHGDPADAWTPHERIRFTLDNGTRLSFVDQRTFGWVLAEDAESGVPDSVSHVALDPFDAAFDRRSVARALGSRRTEVKRALLDQTMVSGIGNIYADEALWRARIHPRRATLGLAVSTGVRLLSSAEEVMREAIVAGGTSFDPLYVNVNGESGWFARDLAAYGRAGEPCRRCGRRIARERFMGRSSYLCPRCQRLA